MNINLLSPVLFYQSPISALQTYNGSTQVYGQPNYLSSCRGCNQNLASSDPASQYQRQKLIQNTVRVYASLYTANLASLSAYQRPPILPQVVEQAGTPYVIPAGVNWNQMSDRPVPSVQKVKTGSGSTYGASSTRHTIVRNRPQAMSPGGVGVDIKHNSYARYLNRIKGQGPIRRGVIPPNYGAPIPFNPAFPIYGGKTVKTSIVNNCNCPIRNSSGDERIYGSPENAFQDKILSVTYKFNVGDNVWALKKSTDTTLYKAKIISIQYNDYVIQFEDDDFITHTSPYNLLIYFDCNCKAQGSLEEQVLRLQKGEIDNAYLNAEGNLLCSVLSSEAASVIF
jgi:hypothetical protein